MELFLQQLANGLVIGSTYSVVAIGFALAFTVLRVTDFAHPDIFDGRNVCRASRPRRNGRLSDSLSPWSQVPRVPVPWASYWNARSLRRCAGATC